MHQDPERDKDARKTGPPAGMHLRIATPVQGSTKPSADPSHFLDELLDPARIMINDPQEMSDQKGR